MLSGRDNFCIGWSGKGSLRRWWAFDRQEGGLQNISDRGNHQIQRPWGENIICVACSRDKLGNQCDRHKKRKREEVREENQEVVRMEWRVWSYRPRRGHWLWLYVRQEATGRWCVEEHSLCGSPWNWRERGISSGLVFHCKEEKTTTFI